MSTPVIDPSKDSSAAIAAITRAHEGKTRTYTAAQIAGTDPISTGPDVFLSASTWGDSDLIRDDGVRFKSNGLIFKRIVDPDKIVKKQPANFMQGNAMQDGATVLNDGDDATAYYANAGGSGTITANKNETINDYDQSIKLTANGSANINVDIVPHFNPTDLSTLDDVTFTVYIHDSTIVGSLLAYVSNNNYAQFFISTTLSISSLKTGWNTFSLKKSDFSTGNGAVWSDIDKVRFRVTASSATPVSVSIGGLFFDDSYKGQILFTFDDVFQNVIDYGLPVFKSNNQPATIYVTKDLQESGTGGYITDQGMQDAHDNYWAVCNHFEHHLSNLNNLTDAEIQAGVDACTLFLQDKGFPYYNHFAYIGSDGFVIPTTATEQSVKDAGMVSAVTVQNLQKFNRNTLTNNLNISRTLLGKGIDYATIAALVDTVIAEGGTLILYGHDIDPNDQSLLINTETNANQWGLGKIQALSDKVANAVRAGTLKQPQTIPDWFYDNDG